MFSIFKFLLNSSVKNLGKDHFKYLNNEFDTNVLDLIKQKRFDPHFKKCKEQLINKGNFCC